MVWKIAAVVMLGPLMSMLDSTVVNVSLSTLSHDLHTTLTTIQWVTSGYLLSLALMLPLSGWLVDRLGVRRVFLGCLVAFTVTSLLCGLANSAGSLILSRVLQGMAGGLLAPLSQMMLARVAGRHVARVMAISMMPVMIGPILGPALAGVILQHAGWRWIFLINLPIGVLATILCWRVLPADSNQRHPRALDLTGFLLLSPGLAMLLHSLDRIGGEASQRLSGGIEMLAALMLLLGFARHSMRRGEKALIDLALFRNRTFLAAALTQFLANCMMFGGQMLLPLFLLIVAGRAPANAGVLLAATGFGSLCIFPWIGRLTEHFGPRAVAAVGGVVSLCGALPFALFDVSTLATPLLCCTLFTRGLGMGCLNIPAISAAYSTTPKNLIPVATTGLNIVQRLGGPVATTVLALYLHYGLTRLPAHTSSAAFIDTFRALCLIHVLGIVAALRLPSKAAHRASGSNAEAIALLDEVA